MFFAQIGQSDSINSHICRPTTIKHLYIGAPAGFEYHPLNGDTQANPGFVNESAPGGIRTHNLLIRRSEQPSPPPFCALLGPQNALKCPLLGLKRAFFPHFSPALFSGCRQIAGRFLPIFPVNPLIRCPPVSQFSRSQRSFRPFYDTS